MPDAGGTLAARAAELLPAGCFTASADPRRTWPLWQGEEGQGMVPRRLAEFSAGRQAARLAMVAAGLQPVAVPKAPDRAPVWPFGLAGSISHSDLACIAAVSTGLAGLGLDLEPLRPLDPAVAALVTGEQDRVVADGDPGLLVFCAKEAAYKAQYPLTRRLFGPEKLAVTITGEVFRARFLGAVAPFERCAEIEGRITLCAGHVLAVAWIATRATA